MATKPKTKASKMVPSQQLTADSSKGEMSPITSNQVNIHVSSSSTGQGSFRDDDLLDSLLDDKKHPVRGRAPRSGPLNRSSATDNIFSLLAEEVKRDGVHTDDSDVSAAEPNDMLKTMPDMDDDAVADLLASKRKPSSAPAQTKPPGNDGPKKDSTVLESNAKPEGADEPTKGGKKPNSAPTSTTRSYRKFTFSDSVGDDEGLGQTPHSEDLDDPLADLLDDLLPDETKPESKSSHIKPEKSPAASPIRKSETTKAAKKAEFTFDDDKDDLMEALGFDSDKNNPKKKETPLWSTNERSDAPHRARTRIDEILEGFPSTLPPTGERKDRLQSPEKRDRTSTGKEPLLDDDLTFGSYQPTLVSTPEGRQSRRQSVRFSTEDVSASTPEMKPQPATPTSSRHRNSSDWLGLKTNDQPSYIEDGAKETKTSAESPKAPSSPSLERRPSSTGTPGTPVVKIAAGAPAPNITKQTKSDISKGQRKAEEEDDWLAGALSRKKVLTASNTETKTSKQEDSLGLGEIGVNESIVSKQAPSGKEDSLPSLREISDTFLGHPSPAAHSTPVREERLKPASLPSSSIVNDHAPTAQHPLRSTLTSSSPTPSHAEVDFGQTLSPPRPSDCPIQVTAPLLAPAASISHPHPHPQPQPKPLHFASTKGSGVLKEPSQASEEALQQPVLPSPLSTILPGTMWFPQQNHMQNTSAVVQQQAAISADSLQQLLLQQQMMQTQLLGLRGVSDAGVLQRLKDKEQQSGDDHTLQARVIQLEGQVKTLQLERDQSQMMLENIQQRHKQDLELMENTHKTRVKLLEDSAAQRETRARHECDQLMERLVSVTRSAEQDRSELQAQHQRKVAQAQQDRDREVERLRDLQRKSILEMKSDHEDQVQRLKKLKDEEIDAVTSATSQTRSLTGVIEQMEQFSSRLGEISSRVESTHEHTTHDLEQGARHRDEQLRIMQDRLAQQQKAMVEERAYLKEIISRMDTQLNEQQRQLEKERWKMTAEQAKAESTQRGLEEERRVLSMQISMEREELERAKSALLEEQKSVMQHCADERRKLTAEWTHFHAQEKQRHERVEREVSSLLEKREDSIISLAQEQADLKLRMAELRQKEMSVAQERETLERLREELDREKERISSTALRLKTRAQEVEAFSKLAAEKYEEGEGALQEARRVQAEHEARLRNIHSQTEHLRQQEQRILKERMRLNNLQDTERLRQNHPVTPLPQIIPPVLPDSVPVLSNPDLAATLNVPAPASCTNSQSMTLQASLALWKYTAEKDREYLQEEQIFLENLKKKSYRAAFSTE